MKTYLPKMNSLEILQYLQITSAHALGVYPADQISKFWSKSTAVVLNCDVSHLPGSHWTAVHVAANGRGTYFDSYGVPPFVPQHLDCLRRNSTLFRWNTKQLQSTYSNVCGQFCVMFLFYLCNDYSLHDFHELFTGDLLKNNRIVVDFHKKLLDKYKLKSVVLPNSKSGGCHDCVVPLNKLESCVQSCSTKLATLYLL